MELGVLKSKSPCFLLNESVNSNINETESKMENPTPAYTFRRRTLYFSSCKNQELKLKLVKKRRARNKTQNALKRMHFVTFILFEGNFFKNLFYLNVQCLYILLNKLSEYIYFYI